MVWVYLSRSLALHNWLLFLLKVVFGWVDQICYRSVIELLIFCWLGSTLFPVNKFVTSIRNSASIGSIDYQIRRLHFLVQKVVDPAITIRVKTPSNAEQHFSFLAHIFHWGRPGERRCRLDLIASGHRKQGILLLIFGLETARLEPGRTFRLPLNCARSVRPRSDQVRGTALERCSSNAFTLLLSKQIRSNT